MGESDEIIGEFDDDPLPEGDEIYDDPSRFQPQPEQKSNVVDVEIVADEYTDAIMSDHPGPTTPDDPDSSLSVDPGATPYPGSALMTLSDAVEAAAFMRERQAAHVRNTRRR